MRISTPSRGRSRTIEVSVAKKDPPLASSTTATRLTSGVRRASSTASGSKVAGMLSMTNQPMSSRARAAVDLPAPDMPVTSASCKE